MTLQDHDVAPDNAPPPPLPEPLARVHGDNPWGVSPSAQIAGPPQSAPAETSVAHGASPGSSPPPLTGTPGTPAAPRGTAVAVVLMVVIGLFTAGLAAFLVFEGADAPERVASPPGLSPPSALSADTPASAHPAEVGKFEPVPPSRDPEAGKFEPLPP